MRRRRLICVGDYLVLFSKKNTQELWKLNNLRVKPAVFLLISLSADIVGKHFTNWNFYSWFLRRLVNQSKIPLGTRLFNVWGIQIISVIWFMLSHVTCRQGMRFTRFSTFAWAPQRPQAVLGSETQIFGNSSSSSTRCIIHFFFEKKSNLPKLFQSPKWCFLQDSEKTINNDF